MLSINSIGKETINSLFTIAMRYRKRSAQDFSHVLKGRVITNAFFEPSTRTSMSFELAAKTLGATFMNFDITIFVMIKMKNLIDSFFLVFIMRIWFLHILKLS